MISWLITPSTAILSAEGAEADMSATIELRYARRVVAERAPAFISSRTTPSSTNVEFQCGRSGRLLSSSSGGPERQCDWLTPQPAMPYSPGLSVHPKVSPPQNAVESVAVPGTGIRVAK